MNADNITDASRPATGGTSVDRILSIPSMFTEQQPIWTVEDMAQALGLPISTTYRYFQSLLRFEFLDEAPGLGYCLGPAFIEFDRSIRLSDPVARLAKPIMSGLAAHMPPGTLLILCQAYRKKVMCIHQEAVHPFDAAISYERGKPMPFLRGATSKVILAHLSWRQQKREFESNAEMMHLAGLGEDWKAFSGHLRDIRKQGFCISRGEVDPGRMGIAAPIFDRQGKALRSLSAVIWQEQVEEQQINDIAQRIVAAAELLTQALKSPNPATPNANHE